MDAQLSTSYVVCLAIILLVSFALDCPDMEDLECTCETPQSLNRVCHDKRTREIVFELKSFRKTISIYCGNERLLDEYFTTPIHVIKIEVSGCTFAEEWTRNFINSSVSDVYLNMTNNLDFEANSILLKQIPHLRKLRMNGFTSENITKPMFENLTHLKELLLEENHLVTLPSWLFHDLQNLETLSLASNGLTHLPDNLLSGLFKLKYLSLSSNCLRLLPETMFYNLTSLLHLNLQENELYILSEEMLSQNAKLDTLSLEGNQLVGLPVTLLKHAKTLKTLNLSKNPLKQIPDGFLDNQASLREMYLSKCNLTSIPLGLFAKASELEFLSLKQNELDKIRDEDFQNNSMLRVLDLSCNKIGDFDGFPFQNNSELKHLDLSQNTLQTVAPNYLSGLTSLEKLNISSNFISTIGDGAFKDLKILKTLDMSNNALTEISNQYDTELTNDILYLYFNDNNITELPNLRGYYNLRELGLQRNSFTSVKAIKMIMNEERFIDIDLRYNNIKHIDVSELEIHDSDYFRIVNRYYFSQSILFRLQENPLVCDCDLYIFYRYLLRIGDWVTYAGFSYMDTLTCNDPPNLKGQKIVGLQRESFTCPVLEKCPRGCVCLLRKSDETVTVSCKNMKLKTLPESIPGEVTILHVENNRLTGLRELNQSHWKNLKEIYADGNLLTSENPDEWFIPPDLQFLSLKRNLLTAVPEPVKIHAERVKTFKMNLASNSWKCDCSTVQFKTWLSENSGKVSDREEILCFKPFIQKLISMPDNVLCPSDLALNPSLIIIIAIVSLTVLLSIIAMAVFYYKKKTTVLTYMYVHFQCVFNILYKQQDLDEGKIFDAFISYSSDDREIAFEIMNELERKEPYFKLCIHERDWIPGNFITDNIVRSVHSSRKTILILSDNYLKSVWFDIEFQAAYNQMMEEKTDRLIIVLKDHLPPKDSLNKDLRCHLATKTYLEWGEKWFWEKLRYSMLRHVYNFSFSFTKGTFHTVTERSDVAV